MGEISMKAEKIKSFADKVYEKCVDKGMTHEDFGLFVHYITMRKQSVSADLMRQARRMVLPSLEDNP